MNELNESAMLYNYLLIGGVLFALGLIGFVVRRNMIVMFLCAEMMLQGISVSLVAWSRFHDDWGGQMLVLFIIAVAAAEAGIALALILMLFHQSGSLDMAFWQELREDDQPTFIHHREAKDDGRDRVWPTLTPAGIEPEVDPEAQLHRSKI